MIVCGGNHTIIQNKKNEIYVCGSNCYGQLGLGDYYNRDKFEKVKHNFDRIKKIVCGGYHTVIQNEKDEIYVCGLNREGQLGLHSNNKNRNKFEKVEYKFGKIKNILCGGNYMIIQNEKNEVYVCGDNGQGQLGLGDRKNRNEFEKIEQNFGEIKNIACGVNHTVIQNEENEIYVCGWNEHGQLGLGGHKHRNKFEKNFERVEYDFGKIKNIACGYTHTVIQNEKNEVYVCGSNNCGQLGLGDNDDGNIFEKVEYDFGEIKNVVCGIFHTVIQNDKNEVYLCGYGKYGQLGLGDYRNRNKFKKVKYEFGEIKNITCGEYHMVIQNEKNEIYVCGLNEYGQLGLGDNKDRNIFEKVDTDDILEQIYNFELKLYTEEIVL